MDSGLLQIPLATARYVRFGPLQIDQQRRRVVRDGDELRLQRKTFEVLIALLQKQGELVTRQELKRSLWLIESQVNHDANLNTAINKLRRALGGSTDKVSYIETIPRRGYRFIGAAEFSDIPFVEKKPATSGTSETIAPDREQEARARGVFRPGKSLTVIMVTVFLTGMLLGATAATFWLSRVASHLRHSAFKESRHVLVPSTCLRLYLKSRVQRPPWCIVKGAGPRSSALWKPGKRAARPPVQA